MSCRYRTTPLWLRPLRIGCLQQTPLADTILRITPELLLKASFPTPPPCGQPLQNRVEVPGVRYPGIFTGHTTPPADPDRQSSAPDDQEGVEIRLIVAEIDRHSMKCPWLQQQHRHGRTLFHALADLASNRRFPRKRQTRARSMVQANARHAASIEYDTAASPTDRAVQRSRPCPRQRRPRFPLPYFAAPEAIGEPTFYWATDQQAATTRIHRPAQPGLWFGYEASGLSVPSKSRNKIRRVVGIAASLARNDARGSSRHTLQVSDFDVAVA